MLVASVQNERSGFTASRMSTAYCSWSQLAVMISAWLRTRMGSVTNETRQEATNTLLTVTQNQMNEALMLWESIANSHWFARSALILFLNKMDLFKEKLPKSPITNHGFTDYHGPKDDYKAASKYFLDKFKALNRNTEKEIYGHFTNATDTNLLKITMASVQDMIIQRNLKQLIL